MLLSLIIPCYNVDLFIDDLCQELSRAKYSNIEFIFVDDVSTDETVNIIKSYKKFDARFKIFKNEENVGLSETREIGVTKSKGQYICFLDGDDLIYLDNLVQLLEIHKGNFDTIIVGYEKFEDVSNKIIKNNDIICFLNDVNFKMTPRSLPILQPCWTHIHNRLFYKENLKYIGREREDRDFAFRSFINSKSLYVRNNIIIHRYRINRRDKNSIMQNELTSKGIKYFLKHLIRFFNEMSNLLISSDDESTYLFASKYLTSISWELITTFTRFDNYNFFEHSLDINKTLELCINIQNKIVSRYNYLYSDINIENFKKIILFKTTIQNGYSVLNISKFRNAKHLEDFINIVENLDFILQREVLSTGRLELENFENEIFILPKERKQLKIITGFLKNETYQEIEKSIKQNFGIDKWSFFDNSKRKLNLKEEKSFIFIKETLLNENNVMFIPTKQLVDLEKSFFKKLSFIYNVEFLFFKENLFHWLAWDYIFTNNIERYFSIIYKNNTLWIKQFYENLIIYENNSKNRFLEIPLNNETYSFQLNSKKLNFQNFTKLPSPNYLPIFKIIDPFNEGNVYSKIKNFCFLSKLENFFNDDVATFLYYWKKIGINYFGQIFESEKKEIEHFFKFTKTFNSAFDVLEEYQKNIDSISHPNDDVLKTFYQVMINFSSNSFHKNKNFNNNFSIMSSYKVGRVKLPSDGISLNSNNFFCLSLNDLSNISLTLNLSIIDKKEISILSGFSKSFENLFSIKTKENVVVIEQNERKILNDFDESITLNFHIQDCNTILDIDGFKDFAFSNKTDLLCIGSNFFEQKQLNFVTLNQLEVKSFQKI